ncbi:hypothetical protein HT031_002668 [Scenedesmus sp. PABB004]|nr:hypothetical protein HT031_002668 [Scenedesmus sp. PABB004]
MSPLFRPVSQDLNVSRVTHVATWFPNLAAIARLDPDEPLPFMHTVRAGAGAAEACRPAGPGAPPAAAAAAGGDARRPRCTAQVHRAKIVWAVVFRGVVGEANLVIKYNTTFDDAVAGVRPKNGELSLRIRREVAEATGTTGAEGQQRLYDALAAVGAAMQAARDAGWDGKTPALPARRAVEAALARGRRRARATA